MSLKLVAQTRELESLRSQYASLEQDRRADQLAALLARSQGVDASERLLRLPLADIDAVRATDARDDPTATLRTLDLSNGRVGPTEIGALCRNARFVPSLTAVDLSGNGLTDEHAGLLGELIASNGLSTSAGKAKGKKRGARSRSRSRGKGGKAKAAAQKAATAAGGAMQQAGSHIRGLDLSNNDLGPPTVEELVNRLVGGKGGSTEGVSLTSLDLTGNARITGGKGVGPLFGALLARGSTTLSHLAITLNEAPMPDPVKDQAEAEAALGLAAPKKRGKKGAKGERRKRSKSPGKKGKKGKKTKKGAARVDVGLLGNLGDAEALAAGLMKAEAPTLTSLSLAGSTLLVASVRPLLRAARSLTALDLSCTFIGALGADAIAENVHALTALVSLNLRMCAIGGRSAHRMLRAFDWSDGAGAARSITDLDLRSNEIDDDAATVLGAVVADHGTLTRVDVSDNPIGTAGGKALARAMFASSVLLSLGRSPSFGPALSHAVVAQGEARRRQQAESGRITRESDQLLDGDSAARILLTPWVRVWSAPAPTGIVVPVLFRRPRTEEVEAAVPFDACRLVETYVPRSGAMRLEWRTILATSSPPSVSTAGLSRAPGSAALGSGRGDETWRMHWVVTLDDADGSRAEAGSVVASGSEADASALDQLMAYSSRVLAEKAEAAARAHDGGGGGGGAASSTDGDATDTLDTASSPRHPAAELVTPRQTLPQTRLVAMPGKPGVFGDDALALVRSPAWYNAVLPECREGQRLTVWAWCSAPRVGAGARDGSAPAGAAVAHVTDVWLEQARDDAAAEAAARGADAGAAQGLSLDEDAVAPLPLAGADPFAPARAWV